MKKAILFIFFAIGYNISSAQFNPLTKQIDSLLKSIYNDSLPGISIGIVHDNKKIFEKSYG